MIFALAILACNTDPQGPGNNPLPPGADVPDRPTAPPPPGTDPVDPLAVCDAGDDVWVQRVFPLVLGRRPHSTEEVRMWAAVAAEHGRPEVIRALTKSQEYVSWWKLNLSDWVHATREGILGDDSACFETPELAGHDGSLTAYIRENGPLGSDYGPVFNMADVMVDGLIADDLSVVYRANLFARTDLYSFFSDTPEEEESLQRVVLGDNLLETYIDRDVNCMICHNSEYSTTDNADPALDRAWSASGLFEKALFGDSSGPLVMDEFYSSNKVYGVIGAGIFFPDDGNYTEEPWGMTANCGSFDPQPFPQDLLGVDRAYFGGDLGPSGSLWEIEQLLADGVVALEDGRTVNPDGSVDPAEAFAYMTGQHVVDKAWQMAFGTRLLLPYGMSRNADQQQQLQSLTEAFVGGNWSMTELLVNITSNPYFNAGLPETCGADPYGMDPIIDPYTTETEGELANNGPGELVRRYTARGLLRSLHSAMEWAQPTEYFGFAFGNDDELDLQVAMGVFHSEIQQGFNGIDFQGLLVWEESLYACQNPAGGNAGFLRELYDAAYDQDLTVADMALALKDRLVQRSVFEDATEETMVEELLQLKLTDKVRDVDQAVLGMNMGLFCGVLTQSPAFMITSEPVPTAAPTKLRLDVDQDCANLEMLTAAAGIEATCD